MNPHLDSSSALSLLKKSDLETFVFELLDFLCIIFFGRKGRTCRELKFSSLGFTITYIYRVIQKSVPEPSSSGAAKYSIYPKFAAKAVSLVIYLSNSQKKIFILCFNFITNINICKFILKNI